MGTAIFEKDGGPLCRLGPSLLSYQGGSGPVVLLSPGANTGGLIIKSCVIWLNSSTPSAHLYMTDGAATIPIAARTGGTGATNIDRPLFIPPGFGVVATGSTADAFIYATYEIL